MSEDPFQMITAFATAFANALEQIGMARREALEKEKDEKRIAAETARSERDSRGRFKRNNSARKLATATQNARERRCAMRDVETGPSRIGQ